ncbi:MAG: 23S rRNA (pseudouridine(1915)-N(3))-methyltransferase RlmH [Gammaproteobacteria bacterium]
MRVRLLTVSGRPPAWAEAAFREYAKRLPPALKFTAPRIPLARGHARDARRAMAGEGARLLAALTPEETVVALDERGESWTTTVLARRLKSWQMSRRDVAFLVGGPDGLAPACRERADLAWSLSALTLPHALVRVLVAEQLYRAVSLNAGHPYHRA